MLEASDTLQSFYSKMESSVTTRRDADPTTLDQGPKRELHQKSQNYIYRKRRITDLSAVGAQAQAFFPIMMQSAMMKSFSTRRLDPSPATDIASRDGLSIYYHPLLSS